MLRDEKNTDCLTCGRDYPRKVHHNDYGDYGEYQCPDCAYDLLYRLSAQSGQPANLPAPITGPDDMNVPELLLDRPRWNLFELYWQPSFTVGYINGRKVYDPFGAAPYISHVLDKC